MLTSQRDRFDIPRDISYLNAAYMGPLSHDVVAAGRAGLERKMHPWTVTAPDFFDEVDQVRLLFAQVIGADADGVAVIPAVSYGIGVVAHNVTISAGQRIVVQAEQFPSNVYSWMDLAERTGAELWTVPRPVPHRSDWTTGVLEAVDDRTAVVAVETCHWTDGGLLDLVAVGEAARASGSLLVVDGTQSVGAMPFDVAAVRPDVLVTAVYKWLLAPYGGAVMWCAPHLRHGRPLERSWITRDRAEDFAGLVAYNDAFRTGARRYDVGQTSDFAKIPAVVAALRQALAWGVAEVGDYANGLNALVAEAAAELGLHVTPGHAPHLMGVHLGDADPQQVAAAMADANVFVSVRGGAMRISPHVYNDEQDVERLIEALRRAI